jgi:rsbT antagonist protein RsbS
MRVPILKQGEYLIASLQSALTDQELVAVFDDVIEQVGRHRTRGVVVDVTALDVLDSFAVRTLRSMSIALKLRGAETVIVGIQPEVALAMVQLGLRLEDVPAALDLEEGLEYLAALGRRRSVDGFAGGGGKGFDRVSQHQHER